MPRERTQQSDAIGILDSGLDFEIRQQGSTVWIALFGILDRPRLVQLQAQLVPLLQRRGRCLVLDGRRLHHIDYRVVRELVIWNRRLRGFGHQLLLYRWSGYLKAIISMEDWERELCGSVAMMAEPPLDRTLAPGLLR